MTETAIRCAIYTRKSSEEGLSQAFNSLHAQREACESYIASQGTLGWCALPEQYDDGGHSGGGMNRPALRRLLADVRAHRVDIVVVYKVDRLTRSLADFARLIEMLEANKVALVSVTQAFNTTSSMGKLTLNVLLSFAQFERDITGERIRDKIAASKARGMWMGGLPPLGYDPPAGRDGRLQVNEVEAATVRYIFSCYLEAGRFQLCQSRLAAAGVRSKRRISKSGRLSGGCKFSNGALRHLLQNRIYLGEITHKGNVFAGRHDAIVDRATFDAAQVLLAASSRRRREHVKLADRSLLRGLLFDTDGQAMEPIVSQNRTRIYAYYASKLAPGLHVEGADDAIRRTPAPAIEELVTTWVARMLRLDVADVGEPEVRSLITRIEVHASRVEVVCRIDHLPGGGSTRTALQRLRASIEPSVGIRLDPAHSARVRLTLPVRLITRGGRKWISSPSGSPAVIQPPDKRLVRQLRRGHRILEACGLASGRVTKPKSGGPKSTYDRIHAELALLAPDIQQAILAGELRGIDVASLPMSWAAQRRLLASTR